MLQRLCLDCTSGLLLLFQNIFLQHKRIYAFSPIIFDEATITMQFLFDDVFETNFKLYGSLYDSFFMISVVEINQLWGNYLSYNSNCKNTNLVILFCLRDNKIHKYFMIFFCILSDTLHIQGSLSNCHKVIDFDVYILSKVSIFHMTKLLFRITQLSEDVEVLLIQTTFIKESSYP